MLFIVFIPCVLVEGFVSGSLMIKGGPISLLESPTEFWFTVGFYLLIFILSVVVLTSKIRGVVKKSGGQYDYDSVKAAIWKLLDNEAT